MPRMASVQSEWNMLCQYVLIQQNINLYVMVMIHVKIKFDGKKQHLGFQEFVFAFNISIICMTNFTMILI